MTATVRRGPLSSLARRAVLILTALAFAGVILTATAQPASAEDCKPAVVPMVAGEGLTGDIDDQSTAVQPETFYGRYGWAGLKWTTCDLPKTNLGLPTAESVDMRFDTWIGNVGLGLAAGLGAIMTQMHQWAVNPSSILTPVDALLTDVTKAIKDSTWGPYVQPLIIIAAAGVLLSALRSEVRRSARTVAAVLLACFAVAWVSTEVTTNVVTDELDKETGKPIVHEVTWSGAEYSAKVFDGVAATIVGGVDSSIAGVVADEDAPIPDDEARGSTMHDRLLYNIWARGAVGDEEAQDKWGKQLYKASVVEWSNADKVDSDAKQDEFNEIAQKMKAEDSYAYDTLRGTKYGRSGQGLLAALIMICIAVIRIPAEMLMIAGMLIMRVLVMFAPVFALAAILEATRPIAKAAVKIALASVINVAIYGVIAAIHTAATGKIITESESTVLAAVLILALTLVVAMIAKPFRSVTRLGTGQQAADQMTNAGQAGGNLLKTAAGVAIGTATGMKTKADDDEKEQSQPEPIRDDLIPPPPDHDSAELGRDDPLPVTIIQVPPHGPVGELGQGEPVLEPTAGPDVYAPDAPQHRYALPGNTGNGSSGGDSSPDISGGPDQSQPIAIRSSIEDETEWNGELVTAEPVTVWREVRVEDDPNIFRPEVITTDAHVIDGQIIIEGEVTDVQLDEYATNAALDQAVEQTVDQHGPIEVEPIEVDSPEVEPIQGTDETIRRTVTLDDRVVHRVGRHVEIVRDDVIDNGPRYIEPEFGPDGRLTTEYFRPDPAELARLNELDEARR